MITPKRTAARAAAAAAAVACLAAACGGTTSDEGQAGRTPGQPIKIVFESYTFGTGAAGAGTAKLVEEFEAAHPDIDIEPVGTPAGEIHVSVQTKAAAGRAPDVAQIGWSKFSFVLENLPYAPIETIAGDEWQEHVKGMVPEAVAIGEHDDEVVGLASIVSTPILIYNADLLNKAGVDPDDPPQTWEDVKRAGLAVAANGAEGVYVAAADPAKSDYLTQSLIYSNGGEILNDKGDVVFDSPQAVEALAVIQDLTTSGAQPSVQAADALKLFEAGRLGMLVVSSAPLGSLTKAAEGVFDLRTAGMPAYGDRPIAPTNSGAGLFVFAEDKARQAAAWEFVKFLTSDRGFTIATSMIGYLPLRPAIVEDPKYLGDFLEKDPRILPAVEQLESLRPYQDLPGRNATRAREILQDEAVTPIILGKADPAATLRAAAERARELLR